MKRRERFAAGCLLLFLLFAFPGWGRAEEAAKVHPMLRNGGSFVFVIREDGIGQYYLCEGLKMYYEDAVPKLRKAMELSAQGRSQSEIMKYFRQK